MTLTKTFTASEISRRGVITGLAVGALVLAVPFKTFALTTQEASGLVTSAVAEINAVIASGKSETAMYADFERIFARYADVPTMARSALGVAGRSATPAQISAFTKAFQGYIARKYGKRFREFIGGQVEVADARQVKNVFEVRAVAKLRGQSPMDVRFYVSPKATSNKFYNVVVEGVDLLLTERTEIAAMLERRRGDVSAVTADLKAAG